MKQCTKCQEVKALTEFYRETLKPDGLQNHCKSCDNFRKNLWVSKNKDKARAHQAISDSNKYAKNKSKINQRNKAWKTKNPAKQRAIDARRRSAILNRTPKWLTNDDCWAIEQAYELAVLRTKLLGFPWHVDHILPLQGKKVSGLHVPLNLQVIPAKENLLKSNKLLIT